MITGKYLELYKELLKVIPKNRLLHDSLSTIAFGTDASFYRLIPKLIVKAYNDAEIQYIIEKANILSIPLTFRAAGTSLSGQAISDSVLVIATHGWRKHTILDDGDKIKLQVGIRGAEANRFLLKYGKKIGPDPASIDSAMIGGIAANNASGMCCGTSENSYKTIDNIRVILSDGTLLDTCDEVSCNNFKKSHLEIIEKLESLSNQINEDDVLRERIKHKFKIKNTTGYSLNALVDYSDGMDILKHLMIGSEGTLGFISDITYRTVIENRNKALSLIIYPNIESACEAVIILKNQPVSAVEIMDRAALKSVEDAKDVPEYLKSLSKNACAILVETSENSLEQLNNNVLSICDSIKNITTELPINFTYDSKEQKVLWKIRKETFPTVAGMRKSGSTPIIEDICFPIKSLAKGTLDLQALFIKHGYHEAVIFGHALEGNLHFVFNPDFQNPDEITRYSNFMDDVVNLVVDKYDGSLKAEHGTGRNMAPFVEKEWGSQAYQLMKDIKILFDPKGILNPGVILNDDKEIHLKNLKPIPSTRESVDRCMECGFCEGVCVSEGLTLSPRQRIVVFKEIQRLQKSGEEPHRCAELNSLYKYQGDQTCATDGLCYTKCPLKIDTGKLIKEIRQESNSLKANKRALALAKNMDYVTKGMRIGLNSVHFMRLAVGKRVFGTIAKSANKISGGLIPLWNEYFPKAAKKIEYTNSIIESHEKSTNKYVVYFPSCITRSMGNSKGKSKEMELTQITKLLIERAGYTIVYPKDMNKLCCGMSFSSKGFVEAGEEASNKLEEALYKASDGGRIPVLCDMSPCLYTMKNNFGDRIKLYEPAEFIIKYLIENLTINKLDKKVSVFAVCSAKKMEVDNYLYQLANLCAKEVTIIDSNCCGFAGDRGFLVPELNQHGLRNLSEQTKGSLQGYATSRTCEIGLSNHSGIEFNSIIYLVEEASR